MSISSKIKWLVKSTLRASAIPTLWQERLLFWFKLGYWPNFRSPKTFCEKLHYRKLWVRDPQLAVISDKYRVRQWVTAHCQTDILIPVKFIGRELTPEQLLELGDDCVVKRNNDSGSVYLIKENTIEEATRVCKELAENINYGCRTNEWWYQEIEPLIIIEERLQGGCDEEPPLDFKFFVFENASKETFMFLEVIRRCSNGSVHCGVFDDKAEPVVESGIPVSRVGCSQWEGEFPLSIDRFEAMKEIALRLSRGFSFMRVDLYHVNNKIYFGELTPCPSEGRCCYSSKKFDQMVGDQWANFESLTVESSNEASVRHYRLQDSPQPIRNHHLREV